MATLKPQSQHRPNASITAGVAFKDQETEPERLFMLKQCCDMLLAGGYFRARISALTPFDRVVGGMVWSITASNVDVDVDVIFEEHSNLGQRIAIADSIIRAIVKMKCPFQLQSQQIQGLHYDSLFPVLQWLVRKVIETRQLTGDMVRAQSESQFGKHFALPSDEHPPEARSFVASVVEQYRPQRLFQRKDRAAAMAAAAGASAATQGAKARSELTLLEYGEKLFFRADAEEASGAASGEESAGGKAFSAKRQQIAAKFGDTQQSAEERRKKEAEEKRKAEEAEAARVEGLKANLAAAGGDGQVRVGFLADASKIEDFEAELKRQEEAQRDAVPAGERGKAVEFKRRTEALRRRIAELEGATADARASNEREKARVAALREELERRSAYSQRCQQELAKLDEVERTHPNRAMLGQLKALVLLNEQLKRQEADFRASCLQQRAEYEELIARVESTSADDEETKRMLEIEAIHEADLAKLNKLRQVLAQKNQEIARINRAIDDIPTRAELIQYERRFVELYELVAEKLIETRKYFAMYNTLEETHRFMTSEVSLLESINKNFPAHSKTKAGLQAFLDSFKALIEGVDKNIVQAERDNAQEVAEKERLDNRLKQLLEHQRAYFKAIKEFQEECYKSERLSEMLAQYQQAAAAAAGAEEAPGAE